MLVDYSSSEEEADDDKVQDSIKSFSKISSKDKLPSAVELLGEISRNTYEDVPEEHEGRIRSFGHERGNWATFCYIPFERNEGILKLQAQIKDSAREELNLQLTEATDLHISLTKTVILRHHWIDPFVASLEQRLRNTQKFPLHLNSLKIYCNEERTRTFIGLTTSEEFFANLKNVVEKCDESLKEFNLECFYRELSFHVSILWIVGDHQKALSKLEDNFKEHFLNILGQNFDDFETNVEKILCKCGNKLYQFALK